MIVNNTHTHIYKKINNTQNICRLVQSNKFQSFTSWYASVCGIFKKWNVFGGPGVKTYRSVPFIKNRKESNCNELEKRDPITIFVSVYTYTYSYVHVWVYVCGYIRVCDVCLFVWVWVCKVIFFFKQTVLGLGLLVSFFNQPFVLKPVQPGVYKQYIYKKTASNTHLPHKKNLTFYISVCGCVCIYVPLSI